MLKKSLIAIAAVALLAMPAATWAVGILAQEQIPVVMVIDKTVTLDIDPAQIEVFNQGGNRWQGHTWVHMTNNFNVDVIATIFPVGPALGWWECALGRDTTSLQTATWDTRVVDSVPPMPGPTGIYFVVGAQLYNADISLMPSDPAPQQVATVLLTIVDTY